jgi:hypothetical protein
MAQTRPFIVKLQMENKTNKWERWFWHSKVKERCAYYEAKAFTGITGHPRRSAREKVFCLHPNSLHHIGETQAPCKGDKMRCDVPRSKRII